MKKILKLISAALAMAILLVSPAMPAAAASAASETKYYIKALFDNVNVREGPGTAYEIVGKAVRGAKYPCLGSSIDASGTTWYRLECNVPDAWISGDYSHRYLRKITGSAAPASKDKSGSKNNAAIQEIINETAEEYGASGIQVAVIRGSDGALFTWNSGYATKNTKAMTTNTKLRVASISKVLVGICAVKMQEEGLVGLNEDIGDYWGEELPKKITLIDLLSHTSTLRYLGFRGTLDATRAQLISENSYIDGEPGSKSSWMYNNYAIGIAGTTLELAADETLDGYARRSIFKPLGVNASFFSGSFGSDVRLATLYESDGGVERTISEARAIKGSPIPGRNTNAFAGGLTISAKDTAKLFAMLANDGEYDGKQVLEKGSVEQLEERQFRTSEYGGKFYQCLPLRYVKGRYGASRLYYHTGNAYGVIAMASYNPDTGDTVVIITVGANPKRDKYGIYEVCAKLTRKMYKNMDKLGK